MNVILLNLRHFYFLIMTGHIEFQHNFNMSPLIDSPHAHLIRTYPSISWCIPYCFSECWCFRQGCYVQLCSTTDRGTFTMTEMHGFAENEGIISCQNEMKWEASIKKCRFMCMTWLRPFSLSLSLFFFFSLFFFLMYGSVCHFRSCHAPQMARAAICGCLI